MIFVIHAEQALVEATFIFGRAEDVSITIIGLWVQRPISRIFNLLGGYVDINFSKFGVVI